jgi:PAS domain S-box-containing protein
MQSNCDHDSSSANAKKPSRRAMLPCLQLATAAAFIIGVAAVSLTLVKNSRSNAAEELVGRGSTVTSIIARLAGRAAAKYSSEDAELALDRVIYDVRAEEGLEFAFISGRTGRAVAHSDASMKGHNQAETLAIGGGELRATGSVEHGPDLRYTIYNSGGSEYAFESTRTVYEFVRTVPLSKRARERYGELELHMAFSLPGFWPFAQSSLKRAAPALAVAFLLLIAGNFLAGIFIRPLRKLRSRTAEAADAGEDEQSWQLDVQASGEIAEIAENWNRMVENFRASYQQVLDARRDLEVRNRVMLYEKRRTEAIIESLSDGVIVTDNYGKVSFVNREAMSLLGVEQDTVMGSPPDTTIPVEPVRAFLAEALKPARSDAGQSSLGASRPRLQRRAQDIEIERPNGKRHVHVMHVPVLDSNGKLIGAVTTFRDVTQAKLEEEARKEFVSSVTHELRAPLTTIKSYVEMLIDDEAGDPELQREFFNTINEETDRLARLINDMLNMSKMEVGNMVLNKALVRTRKLIEDAVNGVRSSARGKHIELTANVSEALPDVEADKELVRVVVTNLLSNGIKYTPEGGKVFLSAELVRDPSSPAQQGYISVSVADNGPGVPADERDKIFEKFYRGRQAVADSRLVGNGLGLALARQVATLHGGDIRLESTEGVGSKFTFLLPAAETSRKVSGGADV